MKIYQEKDYDALSRRAANLISAEVIRKPDCVLGLATGSTPVGTYRQLSAWNQKGDFSFKDVRTVNLDEYLGLPPTHDQSYRYFMQENLFDKIDIPFEHTHVPDGMAADPEQECRRYDELVRSLGYADLQLLGLGRNGHIGFNEPRDCFRNSCGRAYPEHDRSKRKIFRERGGCSEESNHNGNRLYYGSPPCTSCSVRCKQSRSGLPHCMRSDHPAVSGIDPSAS